MQLETTGSRRADPAIVLRKGPGLTVIAPTFNERDNVEPLIAKLSAALDGIHWEVIFVDDDSPDGTAKRVRELARLDARVRCVQRLGRRGLTSACAEAVLASSAPYIAIIDADLQHDETLLPRMLEILQTGDADVVIGSRYTERKLSEGFSRARQGMSFIATRLA
ncbi:MAG: glycosyltransferase, partial [Rhodomicrobium sp.]|nr:glycosyltransferase [Rhodomicrobium sp.]